MSGKPIKVETVKGIETMMKLNNDIIAMLTQINKFKMATKEAEKNIKEAKDKKTKYVFRPSLGGTFIRVSGNDPEYMKFLEATKTQLDNQIKGVEGQLSHRQEGMNEELLKTLNNLICHACEEELVASKGCRRNFDRLINPQPKKEEILETNIPKKEIIKNPKKE